MIHAGFADAYDSEKSGFEEEENDWVDVPVEATAFLGAVAAFVVLLLVFFLYLNKKWCFYGIGGFPCCDEPLRKARSGHGRSKELGQSYYGCEEAAPEYSSSDSDEDVFRRLRRSASVQALPSRQPLQGGPAGLRDAPNRRPQRQDAVDQAIPAGRELFGRQGTGRGTLPLASPPPPPVSATGDKGSGADLISLAEKGRVGGGASSGGGSSSCSTTSGDEEAGVRRCHHNHNHHNHQLGGARNGLDGGGELGQRALRHRDPRAYRKAPPPPVQDITLLSETPRDQDCIVVVPQEQHLLEAYPSGGEGEGRGCDSAQQTTSSSTSPSPPPLDERHTNQQQQQQQIQQQQGGDIQSAGDSPPSPTPLVSKCGHLEVAFAYDAPLRKMSVHVLQARGIPARDRGGATHTQVRMLLLPSKKQKHKTKIRQGDNPQYMESFLLHRVNPEDVNSMGVRFRVYGCERMRRERLIGEYMVGFAAINLELETTLWLPLEPRASLAHQSSASDLLSLARSDSTGSTHSMQHGGVPELLLGLAYNGTTGRLSAEIVKGSHFRDLALTRAPDTHVRLCLVSSSGQELAHSKTSVRRSQPNPLFKEVFMFQVALFQLPDVTLMVSVYNKRSMKRKEMVGWFSLGLNSSGEEELAHWNDMRDAKGEQICRWHVLLES